MSTAFTDTRGLLVGVNNYRDGIDDLTAVEADLREMADLLSVESTPDRFRILSDADAVRSDIEAALDEVADVGASTDLAVLYFAGHGTGRGGTHFFVPYDYASEDGIPLENIRSAVEEADAQATILFLDICYSGGVVGRSEEVSIDETAQTLKRELQRVSGSGKAIFAACTGDETAGEDPVLGHGAFTNYVLAGLRGAAATPRGDVTANSLHDYVVHSLQQYDQTPVYHTNATGSLTLVHRESSVSPPDNRGQTPGSGDTRVDDSGDYVLLDGEIYRATSIRYESGEGTVSIQLPSDSGTIDSHIERISGGPTTSHGTNRGDTVELAYDHRAGVVRVTDAELQRSSEKRHWEITAELQENRRSNGRRFGTVRANEKTFDKTDIARIRTRQFLFGETPDVERTTRGMLGLTDELGPGSSPPLRDFLSEHRQPSEDDLQRMRLRLLLRLVDLNIVDRVQYLSLGPMTESGLQVTLRGELESRYSDREPDIIEVEGSTSPVR